MSIRNAKLVGDAMLDAVIRICAAQERRDPDNRGLEGVDFLKLVDYVCPYLSSTHLLMRDGEAAVRNN